jgi:membrane-bound lytic murein transglycosylase F
MMGRIGRMPAALWLAIGALLLFAAACTPKPRALDEIRARGKLRVVTLNNPTSFYYGAHGAEGLEFELTRAFAEELAVTLVITPVADARAMQAELAAGRADLAAARITADDSWAGIALPTAPYEHVPQVVVFRRGETRPRGTLQIENARLAVRAGSPQERMLDQMRRTVAPTLTWVSTAPSSADPLEDVQSGQADYALVDSREYSFARHLYPKVGVGFALPSERPTQWMVHHEAHDLLEAADLFLRTAARSGRLAAMIKHSSGDSRRFEYLESRNFQAHVLERLPKLRTWFEEAGQQTGLDWRLLAAVGYQESKWSPVAESGDGALGIMMLTGDTAAELGVKDRSNPRESIFGGARYLVQVREKVPSRIAEPDRTWLTVASYNVGFGHLEDARVLAQERGKNPDSWEDVREHLPLLAQERWYAKAKRGYARGWEPVQFVEGVQRYLRLLEWQPTDAVAGEATPVEIEPGG